MRVQKLYSKSTSRWIKNNTRSLPVTGWSIGFASVECSVIHLRVSILINARNQIDTRATRGKLTTGSRAIDQREASCARVFEILKSLLRHKKMRIHGGVVAAHVDPVEFPRHAPNQKHLINALCDAEHGLAINSAHIPKILQLGVNFKLIRQRLKRRGHRDVDATIWTEV